MPIGKYRGVPIADAVDKDPDYVVWLTGQDWFFEKYPSAAECLVASASIAAIPMTKGQPRHDPDSPK